MAAVAEVRVTFPAAVPKTLKAEVMVVVVSAVKANVLPLLSSEKLRVPKVLEPVMVSCPVDPATV